MDNDPASRHRRSFFFLAFVSGIIWISTGLTLLALAPDPVKLSVGAFMGAVSILVFVRFINRRHDLHSATRRRD
jgi:membrane protein implicated in regulation of membrane protease activity